MLANYQSPGDAVTLTAAVRDLHTCYPGEFLTDVRTLWPELWENNPYLTPLDETDPEVTAVECRYPAVEFSNQRGMHFLHGFIEDLNERLGLRITLTRFRGDIHLSEVERAMPSPVAAITGFDVPYWIIVAGGKYDFTIKWWHFRRWQAVVERFRDSLLFVQVGEKEHYHPTLDGVLDLRGKTPLRDLVRLVYHAEGVLCPVTLLMHLAAAVETPRGKAGRSCVVVAGGREPPHWEAYPAHQFIHTVGLLPCCLEGGCWRSRSVPLEDGDVKDGPESLCLDVVNHLPRCMHLITPETVIERIEFCLAARQAPPETASRLRGRAHFSREDSEQFTRPTNPRRTPWWQECADNHQQKQNMPQPSTNTAGSESTTGPAAQVEPLNETEQKFATAIAERVPPFNWIPPKTLPLATTESQRENYGVKIEDLEKECVARKDKGVAGKAEHHGKNRIENIPHPESSFEHDDPVPKDEKELMQLPAEKVESFRRMEAAFKWIVCRAGSLLTEINDVVKAIEKHDATLDDYLAVRERYIEFIRNLNHREPGPEEIDPKRGFGYGRNLHWAHVDPVIKAVELPGFPKAIFLITGLTLVAEWNPHVSSSGVPVKHS